MYLAFRLITLLYWLNFSSLFPLYFSSAFVLICQTSFSLLTDGNTFNSFPPVQVPVVLPTLFCLIQHRISEGTGPIFFCPVSPLLHFFMVYDRMAILSSHSTSRYFYAPIFFPLSRCLIKESSCSEYQTQYQSTSTRNFEFKFDTMQIQEMYNGLKS